MAEKLIKKTELLAKAAKATGLKPTTLEGYLWHSRIKPYTQRIDGGRCCNFYQPADLQVFVTWVKANKRR